MYIFPIKNGDIPASYVSLSEGIYTFAVHFVVVPLQAPKAPQLRRVPGPVGLGASGAPTVGWVGGMILGIPTWMDGWKIYENSWIWWRWVYFVLEIWWILSENVWVESDMLMAVVANLRLVVICLQHAGFVDKHAVSYVADSIIVFDDFPYWRGYREYDICNIIWYYDVYLYIILLFKYVRIYTNIYLNQLVYMQIYNI